MANSVASSKKQLLPLTGMRFFLALWVIVYHQPFLYGYSWMTAFPRPLPAVLNSGYLAVGLFFVLSGFVLAYNYPLAEPWSSGYRRRFGVARFSRIYPAYCIGLLLSAPFVILPLMKSILLMGLGRNLTTAALTWTLLQAWIPQTAMAWNGPGWSLSVEAFFYACFPFIGALLWKVSRPRTLLCAGLVIWAAAVLAPLAATLLPLHDIAGIPASLWNRDSEGAWVYFVRFNPLFQLPQFCMGIVIARAYDLLRGSNLRWQGRGYWLYLPGILLEVLALALCQSTLFLFVHNGLLLPLHALVVLGLALDGGILARFLSLPPLVLLGNASYAMYIFHGPVGKWMHVIGERVFSTEFAGLTATLFYIALVICFSTIVFKVIEEPAHRILRKKLNSWFDGSHQKDKKVGSELVA
jgi:peptidoglycan/LPS O-acetylase OafA/YrhL